jgi:hypothetical protein
MTQPTGEQRGIFEFALVAASGAGGVAAIANPEGRKVIVDRLILHVETPSSGACTVDAGIAASATTSSDILIDGVSIATAEKVVDNIEDQGTNGESCQIWDSDEYLTITVASGTVTGLVGTGYVHYVPVG